MGSSDAGTLEGAGEGWVMTKRTQVLNVEISDWIVGFCHRILRCVWSIPLNQQGEATGENKQSSHTQSKRSIAGGGIPPDRRTEEGRPEQEARDHHDAGGDSVARHLKQGDRWRGPGPHPPEQHPDLVQHRSASPVQEAHHRYFLPDED